MIINCWKCSGPLFKTRSEDIENMGLSMKCPHCHSMVEIEIRTEIVVVVNGKKVERLGEARVRSF